MPPQKKDTCSAWQANSKVPDFSCKLDAGGHTAHLDPKTGIRWGDKPPHGLRKKPVK